MLKVRAIKKIKDQNDKLLGYVVRDIETKQEMAVTKEGLKEAVRDGKVIVTNLTLTKDGRRLLGHACELKVPRKKKVVEAPKSKVVKIVKFGKDTICAIVDMSSIQDYKPIQLKNMKDNTEIVYLDKFLEAAKSNMYENVNLDKDGNVDISAIDKVSFSKFKVKINKLLKENGFESRVGVKRASKDSFYLTVESMDDSWPSTVVEIYKAICVQAVKATKLRVRAVGRGTVEFVGPDTVNQAKKVLEQFK